MLFSRCTSNCVFGYTSASDRISEQIPARQNGFAKPRIRELAINCTHQTRIRANSETPRSQLMCNCQRGAKPRNQYNYYGHHDLRIGWSTPLECRTNQQSSHRTRSRVSFFKLVLHHPNRPQITSLKSVSLVLKRLAGLWRGFSR